MYNPDSSNKIPGLKINVLLLILKNYDLSLFSSSQNDDSQEISGRTFSQRRKKKVQVTNTNFISRLARITDDKVFKSAV